jgi:hypothetical protein
MARRIIPLSLFLLLASPSMAQTQAVKPIKSIKVIKPAPKPKVAPASSSSTVRQGTQATRKVGQGGRTSSGGRAYGPMILTTPLPQNQGFRDAHIPPAELNGDALLSRMEQDRKLKACQADFGKWTGRVEAKSLWATGSDVDEIYGSISVGQVSGAVYSNTRMKPGEGWGKMQLWASKKNVNLGDERQTGLSTITLQTTSPASAISIYFDLHDEDDGRGGSNDESFLINEALGAYDNYRRFEFTVPPCSQNPEFEKTWRETISARDDGSGGSNEVFLDVKVHVWRLYP